MRIVKLIPELPFRIIMEDDIIHSDRFFSAFINNLSIIYENDVVENFIKHFENRKVIISSMFPGLKICRNNQLVNHILFFPKPFARISKYAPSNEIEEEKEKYDKKKAKRIRFVSLEVLKEIFANWDAERGFFRYGLLELPTFGDKYSFHQSEVLLNNDYDRDEFLRLVRKENFITIVDEPKILGSRFETETSNLFSQEETELKEITYGRLKFKPFMFFLLQENLSDDDFKRFYASLRLLCDEGIGPERRIGKGVFKDIQIESIELPQKGNYAMSLSLVFPDKERDNLDNLISYNLVKRGGYIYSNQDSKANYFLKQKIRMFTEGSIFLGEIKGRLQDVSPENLPKEIKLKHKIYRYGINFPLFGGGTDEM